MLSLLSLHPLRASCELLFFPPSISDQRGLYYRFSPGASRVDGNAGRQRQKPPPACPRHSPRAGSFPPNQLGSCTEHANKADGTEQERAGSPTGPIISTLWLSAEAGREACPLPGLPICRLIKPCCCCWEPLLHCHRNASSALSQPRGCPSTELSGLRYTKHRLGVGEADSDCNVLNVLDGAGPRSANP